MLVVALSSLLLAMPERVVVPIGACDPNGFVPVRATSVVVAPGEPSRVLSVHEKLDLPGSVYRTTTNTNCLEPSGEGLEPQFPFYRQTDPVRLAIDPSDPKVVYLASVQGVFKSTDGGLSWSSRSIGIPFVLNEAGVAVVAADPTHPDIVYAGSTYGVFKSVDAGGSWNGVNVGLIRPPSIAPGVSALAIDPRNTDVIYAASLGVYKSEGAGFLWSNRSVGLPPGRINDVVLDAVNANVVYASTPDGVFRSLNGAESWSPFALSGIAVHRLFQDAAEPAFLLASTESGLMESRNGGATFTLILPRSKSGAVRDAMAIPGDRQTLYAAAENGLYVTRNGGQTWEVLRLGSRTTRVVEPR
jgi:photosystem II stability/assembly factor-like uncharacterized protein